MTDVNKCRRVRLARRGQWPRCGTCDKRDAMRALWVTAWESQREMLPQATAQSSVCPRIEHNDRACVLAGSALASVKTADGPGGV